MAEMIPMETLNIFGKTYEIVDEKARNAIEDLADSSCSVGDVLASFPYSSAVNISRTNDTITITIKLNDGTESVSVIELDENGYPKNIVVDNVACSISWDGFEEMGAVVNEQS